MHLVKRNSSGRCLEIAAFCPKLVEVSSRLLAVGCPSCFFVLLVDIFVMPFLTKGMKVMLVFPLRCFFLLNGTNKRIFTDLCVYIKFATETINAVLLNLNYI